MFKKLLSIGAIATCLSFMACGPAAAQFVHPGCLSTQSDLDRMKAKVDTGQQPWTAGYGRLVAAPYGQLGHTPNPQATIYVSGSQPDNYITLARDAGAAYQVALRYHVSGDPAYAAKAVSILMAWANTHTGWNGNTNVSLRAGLYGYQLACAGELVRNYSGWAPADFAKFQNYVRTQFYKIVSPNDVDRGFLFHHHSAPGDCEDRYWANWDMAAMATVIATGVLLDDLSIFQEAIDYFYNGVGVGRINKLLYHRHPNGLGQSQEFGRDQGHATMLVPLLGTFCEIAWNQGVDLYSELDNGFLAMSEHLAKHNLYYSVPYATYMLGCNGTVLTGIGGDGYGTTRAGVDMLYNHFVNRRGMSAPYTKEAAELLRPEGGGGQYGTNSGGFDQLGFTTLTHTLDPIGSGAVPSELRAVVKGPQVTLSWRGSAYARSYNVKRATSPGGPYINLAMVGSKNTTYVDSGLVPGTTFYYVVSANNPGGESANSAQISTANDRQLYGTIIGTTGSIQDKGATREQAFDGCLRTYMEAWAPGGGWVGLDLGDGASAVVTAVKYCPQPGNGADMVGSKFQGSNSPDFSSGVVDLFTITASPPGEVLTTQAISHPTAFRYIRYLRTNPADYYSVVAELQFIGNATGLGAAPPAPGGLAVTPNGSNVNLSWNGSSGATGYVIKRASASGGPYTVLEYTNQWTTTYTDRNPGPGIHHYVISAINNGGESANSTAQSIEFVANVAPGSTTSAHAGSGGGNEGSDKAVDGNVNTKWYSGGGYSSGWLQVDLGAGNAQVVVRYDLTSANDVPGRDPKNWQFQGSNDGSNWTTLDTRTGETFVSRFLTRQFTTTNSTAYRYYRLNILSNFSGNDGIQLAEWALMSQGSPPPADTIPPAPPTGFTATAGDGAVTLDWADNTESDLARYTVHRSTTPGGPYTAIATNLTFSFHTDTTAAGGMTHYYVVTAADTSLNQSAHSAEVSATPQASPPAAPTGLVATAGGGKVSLDWADNAEPDLASYTVYRSTTSGGVFSLIAAGLTSSNYTDNAVANDTKYFYRVTATDTASNQSGTSAEVFATPRSPNPVSLTNPGFESPAAGKIANGFDGSTNVPGWNSGAMQDSGVEAASPNSGQYRAFFMSGDGSAWQTTPHAIAQGDQFTLTFHLLMSGGSGTAVARASLVAWNGSTETVLGFQTFTAGGNWSQQTLSATVPGSATNGQSLRIKLENVGNAGSWLGIDDVALSVVNTTAPSPPTGLSAVAGDGAVDLDWADNAEPGLASYTVYRSTTSGSGYSAIASGLVASGHADTTVVPGTTYYYVVTATGASSNESAASAPVSATAYTAQESWRFTHFGTSANTGDAADDADPDGDGWTNANEFAAGTDPNDRTSLLKIGTLEAGGQDVVIGFPTVAGKSYRVEKSATLLDGSWQTVADPVSGTGATVEITDVGARSQPRWFYRIAVLP